jgi:hypothetical protein
MPDLKRCRVVSLQIADLLWNPIEPLTKFEMIAILENLKGDVEETFHQLKFHKGTLAKEMAAS